VAIVSQNRLLVPGTGLTGTQSLLLVPSVEPIELPEVAPNPVSVIPADLAD
jgi:hypothetical protein